MSCAQYFPTVQKRHSQSYASGAFNRYSENARRESISLGKLRGLTHGASRRQPESCRGTGVSPVHHGPKPYVALNKFTADFASA